MHSFDSRVRYSECDEHGELATTAIVNYLQDCSMFHSESIGLGLSSMQSSHCAWFIAAWQIEILRRPRYCEQISISTWCYEMQRALACRNFLISATDGTPLVRADSLWFVYDSQAGRPVRVPESQMAYLTDDPRLDMPRTRRKLCVEGDSILAPQLSVTEQHLDTNRHVNNAQYIQMATDALADLGIAQDVSRIQVQYQNMALLGDVIVPRVYVEKNGCSVVLAAPALDAVSESSTPTPGITPASTYAIVRFGADAS